MLITSIIIIIIIWRKLDQERERDKENKQNFELMHSLYSV